MTLQLEREPGWTCKVTTRFSEKVNFPQYVLVFPVDAVVLLKL